MSKYYRGVKLAAVLRCGTSKWGYRHLVSKGRWSTSFGKKISRTVATGAVDYQGPGQVIYVDRRNQCPPKEVFRVIVNPGPYNVDHRINPQGVITAYRPTNAASATSC
ncbi:hypothetical protein [Streptomyces sp. NPDC048248]|uniref:hypothetical protein n=1 Tax=Streptomyces sp. NPDC048248 TaxID=3365523 RepID=UPI003719F806